jgi:hypothetical protein
MAKRVIVPAIEKCSACGKSKLSHADDLFFELDESLPEWHGWYSMRRFLGTAVRMHGSRETSAKALGNSKEVAERHYIKPNAVLPDVRKAVNDALNGLIS